MATEAGRSPSLDPRLDALFGFDRDDEDWLRTVRDRRAEPSLGRVGPYELIEVLGRGGQGVVYRARQPGTGREVAIKRISAGLFASPESRARFEREIEAVATLDHPNIVAVYGAEVIDDQPLLVMQAIAGLPFDRWAALAGQRRPRREILGVFVLVCDAIQHAHQRGVIHRDIKPSNILVDSHGRPHVLDFGLARLERATPAAATLTQTGGFLGTPAYAAPEQLRGLVREIDVRSDVYALGAVLYEAL
ncbi:MAG: Serine/threonine-protein kinase PrkC [Phycisphaerae bacterium]|nr:Serine/threonine-protein kinase PrkC [Phycisphaerae bacterium]